MQINKRISQNEILLQLAEEASELAHAALKLRRACTQESPTPVTEDQAMDHLMEEIADVRVCVAQLDGMEHRRIDHQVAVKTERWKARLIDAGAIHYRPCPWCGKEGKPYKFLQMDAQTAYGVWCANKACPIGPSTALYDTPEEAAAAWNGGDAQ